MTRTPKIIPVSDLRQKTSEILKDLSSGDPVFITQRGRAAAVMVSMKAYEHSQQELDILRLLAKGEKANWLNRQIVKRLGKFDMNNSDDMKMITHAMIKSISLTMFIMMPLTAILLLWIFYRRKYYYEDLIFSIHIHTIFFIIFSLILFIQIFINEKFGNKLWPWAFLLCLIYLIASLKNNYKQTLGKTISKFILISIPYFLVSFILTILAVIYGFLA